jgi:hypothetical protein
MDSAISSGIKNVNADQRILPFVLFLVWPFFALIFAIINWRSPWAKNIAWLFCGFFGFTFYIPPGGPDANRYRDNLIEYHHSGIELYDWIPSVFRSEQGKGDFTEPFIRGIVGNFTDDYRILFCVYGLLLGFFLTRNIWFVLDRLNGKIPILSLPFLLVLIFGIGFWEINGFRFWTASHIFIYGLIQLFYFKKSKVGYGLLILAMMTHITFVIPVLLVFISKVLPKSGKFLFFLIFGSYLFGNIPIDSVLNILPDSIFPIGQRYIKAYLLSDIAQNFIELQASKPWFLQLNDVLSKISFTFLCFIYLYRRKYSFDISRGFSALMTFSIINLALYNFLSLFPSMGRFAKLSHIIICMYFIFYVAESKNVKEKYLLFLLFLAPLTLYSIIEIRLGLTFLGPSTIFTSPLFAWVTDVVPAFVK